MRRRDSEIGGQTGEEERKALWYDGDSRFYHLFFLYILLYTIIHYYMLLHLSYSIR